MILINDVWYNPFDLEDISVIIKDSFSYDLAQKMNKLIKENNEKYYDEEDINILEWKINEKQQLICDLREEMEEMEDKNNKLEKENEKLLDMVYNP